MNKYKSDIKKGEMWYKSMVEKYPDNIGILMGYGNILVGLSSFDEGIKMYERAILLKKDLVNAYACIAMIYEYKRINLVKASETARKIL